MTERPILFSGEMVRAILDGRKTQTRRVVKPEPIFQPESKEGRLITKAALIWPKGDQTQKPGGNPPPFGSNILEPTLAGMFGPYGKPGDRLWVKETFQYTDEALNVQPGWVYRATDPDWETLEGWKWKPSIFMPRKASRITLEMESVRVERLRDITDSDAKAEGCCGVASTQWGLPNFRYVWESINGQGSWNVNPWVWVVTFRNISNDKAVRREASDTATGYES